MEKTQIGNFLVWKDETHLLSIKTVLEDCFVKAIKSFLFSFSLSLLLQEGGEDWVKGRRAASISIQQAIIKSLKISSSNWFDIIKYQYYRLAPLQSHHRYQYQSLHHYKTIANISMYTIYGQSCPYQYCQCQYFQ